MNDSKTVWLYGLPCSGKTSIAKVLTKNMKECYPTIHIDGDIVRKTICKEFGFTDEDRTNNLIRIADMCNLLNKQGISTVCSFVTPFKSHRAMLNDYVDTIDMFYVDCPLKVCMDRDVKGMYAKAKVGELDGFTGVGGHFDFPTRVNRVLTNYLTINECANHIAGTLGLYPINYNI